MTNVSVNNVIGVMVYRFIVRVIETCARVCISVYGEQQIRLALVVFLVSIFILNLCC